MPQGFILVATKETQTEGARLSRLGYNLKCADQLTGEVTAWASVVPSAENTGICVDKIWKYRKRDTVLLVCNLFDYGMILPSVSHLTWSGHLRF